MSTITKKDIIALFSKENSLSLKTSAEYVNAFLNTVVEELAQGNEVDITGFGKFTVKDRPVRAGMNPITKEKIEIPASRTVKFSPKKGLKEAVNRDR